jgi:hypothetical protein
MCKAWWSGLGSRKKKKKKGKEQGRRRKDKKNFLDDLRKVLVINCG